MINKKNKLSLFFLIIAIALSGCVSINTGKKNNASLTDGGIWKSIDKGLTWGQKNAILSAAKNQSLAGTSCSVLKIDPNDHNAIYYGAVGNGLFFSYEGGANWQMASGLGKVTVRALDIDVNDKCNIFAATRNRVFRTTDCSRTWKQIYVDSQADATVDAIAVDRLDGNIVYITISRGDIVKSGDRGDSWQTIYRFNKKIGQFVIDPNDNRMAYAAVDGKTVYRSKNNSADWEQISVPLKENQIDDTIQNIIMVSGKPGLIYLATRKGILRTDDAGMAWDKIELIPTDKAAAIEAFSVNPVNDMEIYYIAGNTFFRSADGGENWSPVKIPSTRKGVAIAADPVDPRLVYLGVYLVTK